MRMKRNILALGIALLLSGQALHSQPTEISGIINTYARVVEFDDCGKSAVVEEDLEDQQDMDLAAGDRVLIVQMTGALFHDGDDKNFGTVRHNSSCGMFEFATVESIAEEAPYYRVTFVNSTMNVYQTPPDPQLASPAVQLVKVPQYVDVTVTDDLTAAAWDGATGTGGVLVFEAEGTVTISSANNADISVNGKGFVGGLHSGEGSDQDLYGYVYPASDNKSGVRGGGVGVPVPTDNTGRGPLVNGGGGGNARNAGGGGGGNAGMGGKGGNQQIDLGSKSIGGLGGRALDYSALPIRRVFMGGGGGGGQQDDDTWNLGKGGAGGGIVIIRAANIDGNGRTISANGITGGTGVDVGAGGGGAGGAILLFVSAFENDQNFTPDLQLEAKGGTGGTAQTTVTNDPCRGPGGGGGGGFIGVGIWNAQSLNNIVSLNVDAGNAGNKLSCDNTGAPPNTNNGAMAGVAGMKMFGITPPGDPLP